MRLGNTWQIILINFGGQLRAYEYKSLISEQFDYYNVFDNDHFAEHYVKNLNTEKCFEAALEFANDEMFRTNCESRCLQRLSEIDISHSQKIRFRLKGSTYLFQFFQVVPRLEMDDMLLKANHLLNETYPEKCAQEPRKILLDRLDDLDRDNCNEEDIEEITNFINKLK